MDEKQTEDNGTVTSGPEQSGESTQTAADPQVQPAGALANLVSGVVVILLGTGSLLVALDLGFGNLTQPQAGTWPAILSMLLIVLGIALAALSKTLTDAERISRNAVAVGIGAISIVVAVQLMPVIGFEIPAVLLMVFWMKVLGREKLLKSIIVSVIAVIVLYLVFVTGLRISIPHLF